jgi:2-hydroxy-6-oxonona-2,4-dienedioate hydrolase
MSKLLWICATLAAVLLIAGIGWVTAAFSGDMARAHERLSGRSTLVDSPWGAIEFAEAGTRSGAPVLVVHGSGGGFDQGLLIAEAALGEGWRLILPSRFGYLGSALPPEAGWEAQADAYAHLLDRLGIQQVAVVAMSQGGASALLFALRHPQRVSALACVSCGVRPVPLAAQAGADRLGRWLAWIYQRDARYWVLARFGRRWLLGLMGADAAVIAAMDATQRAQVDALVDSMHPASRRAAGVRLDHHVPLPGERIAGVRAPTLFVHARDDLLQLFDNAAYGAATVPGARLLAFDQGGHLLLVVEQAAVRQAVAAHLKSHASARAPVHGDSQASPPAPGR